MGFRDQPQSLCHRESQFLDLCGLARQLQAPVVDTPIRFTG